MVDFHARPLPPKSCRRPGADPADVLARVFGYGAFRGVQGRVVASVMAGRDVLAVMPTGGGKSLCYQAPALCLPGMTVVVSPLLALMRDQSDRLRSLGVRAAAYVSGLSSDERGRIVAAVCDGSMDMLYVSPERFVSAAFERAFRGVDVSLVAVDEAHCVSEWGHDFRPDYLGVAEAMASKCPSARRLALTATATPSMRSEIAGRILAPDAEIVVAGFDRPNIALSVDRARDVAESAVARVGALAGMGASIVYCRTRNEVDEMAVRLAAAGHAAAGYHAGMEDLDRARVQDGFLAGRLAVISATSAFGMGIDKPDVGAVVHAGLPSGLEAYYQESGRAGRDGRDAVAHLVWSAKDVGRRTAAVAATVAAGGGAAATRRDLARLEHVLGYVEAPSCRRDVLLRRFGEAPSGPCGRCDNCLRPPALRDASVETAAVVAFLRRLGGGRLGAVAEALAGGSGERVTREGLDVLPGYGSLRAAGSAGVRRVARQCVGLGLLEVDDATGEYRPTEAGLATVEGGAPVMLAEELARRRGALTDGLPAWRVAVWESLVAARRGMAAASGRLEHEIVGDAEMAALVAGAGAEALAGRADPAFVARATAVLESARPPDAPAALDTGLF